MNPQATTSRFRLTILLNWINKLAQELEDPHLLTLGRCPNSEETAICNKSFKWIWTLSRNIGFCDVQQKLQNGLDTVQICRFLRCATKASKVFGHCPNVPVFAMCNKSFKYRLDAVQIYRILRRATKELTILLYPKKQNEHVDSRAIQASN